MPLRPILIALLAALPAAASAQAVQPGEWEIVTTVQAVDIPGAPAGAIAAMKGKPQMSRSCLSAADAAKGPQDMMKTNKQCKFTRYSKKGGRLDSQMVCRQDGGTMTATATGSFTPTSFTNRARMVMSGAQKMAMTVTTAGKRVGACAK